MWRLVALDYLGRDISLQYVLGTVNSSRVQYYLMIMLTLLLTRNRSRHGIRKKNHPLTCTPPTYTADSSGHQGIWHGTGIYCSASSRCTSTTNRVRQKRAAPPRRRLLSIVGFSTVSSISNKCSLINTLQGASSCLPALNDFFWMARASPM